jgi:DNA-binding GntR family transcriptional regulator
MAAARWLRRWKRGEGAVNPDKHREGPNSPQQDLSHRPVHRLRPVEVRPVSEVVAERLEALILDGTFRSGDQLPTEPELARALHVGRSTVREAKRALISRGLLESRQKLGTFVVGPPADPSNLASLHSLLTNPQLPDLHESRQIVEVGSIRLAALRSTHQDIDDLYGALAEIGEEIESGREDAWRLRTTTCCSRSSTSPPTSSAITRSPST